MNRVFDIIVYHKMCPDGLAGAWCLKKISQGARLIACPAGCDPYPNVLKEILFEMRGERGQLQRGFNIAFVDVHPSYGWLTVNHASFDKITIIDHHKSFERCIEDIKGDGYIRCKVDIEYDVKYSGCQLAWNYVKRTKIFEEIKLLEPTTSPPSIVNSKVTKAFGESQIEFPWFISYIGDRDLWTWSLPKSKEINSCLIDSRYLFDEEKVFQTFDEYLDSDEDKISKLSTFGEAIDYRNQEIVDTASKFSRYAYFEIKNGTKPKIFLVRITSSSTLISEVGSELCKPRSDVELRPDFGVVFNYDGKYNKFSFSIRGSNESPDLSEISKMLGGGGHAKASGFKLDYNPFVKSSLDPLYQLLFKPFLRIRYI